MAGFFAENSAAQVGIWGVNVLLQVTFIAAVSLAVAASATRRAALRHAVLCGALLLLFIAPGAACVMQACGVGLPALTLSDEAPVNPEGDSGADNRPAILADSISNPALQQTATASAGGSVSPAQDATPIRNPAAEGRSRRDDNQRSAETPDSTAATAQASSSIQNTVTVASPASSLPVLLRRHALSLVVIWLAGSALLLARLVMMGYRLAVVLRTSQPVSCDRINAAFLEACRTMNVGNSPGLAMSPCVTSPLAVGFRRPRIILPEFLPESISADQLRQVLVHELAHVVRRDPLVALLQNVAGAVFWLHPLVHVLNRQLAQAREELCDNHVLNIADAPAYSRTLLQLAEQTTAWRPLPGAVALLTSRWRLEHRISGILDERRNVATRLTSGSRLRVGLVLLGSATVAAVAGTISAPAARPVAVARDALPTAERQITADGPILESIDLAALSDHSAPSADPPEEGQITDIAEMMKVLEQIARDSQAGYEKIRTWSGKGTYIESSVWDTGKQAGSRVERRAELQFVLDNQANALRVEWEETEPVRLFSADAERGRLLTKNLNRFQSILTADNWFDFRTSRRFSTDEPPIFPYDSSTASRVLMIRAPGEADGARHETEGMIDPRVWASIIGRHVHGLRRFFWEEHDWLKENDEKKRRDGKPATAFLQSEVVRRKTDVGTVILVRRYWKSKEGPLDKSHPHTLRREITFEERHGYAMTRCEFASGGRISESSEISFERNREIAVPVRFIRTVFNTGAGHRAATMEVRLTESQINESVDAGRFARDSLPLQDGERIHDTRRDQGFVIENGEPIAVEKNPKSRMGWEPQASTSLWQHAIMGREWNDLVRESVELNNRGIKSTAEELPDLERSEAYRLNREAWEALAHRYIALHLRQDPVHQDRLDGLNCLGQVIRMEFAGPASEEASGILLRENALTGDQQWFAMLLAYSMPASLSAETVLRGMLAQSESRATQAQARMSLARFLVEQAERKRMVEALPGRDRQVVDKYGDWYLNRIRQVDPDAAEREAEKLWREVIEKYADVEGLTNEKVKLAVQAQRDLLRLQHAMGRKAPEIIGHDIDGNALKLSDTNGKVRVLMFWGHWCSPCRGHYAHLRELATKHAGAPFAVLGVCSDKEKSTIRKAIDSGDVTWRFWWDGDDDRWRIHKEWGLAGAPWFFVLDRDGVIRFAGIRGAELDAAIELLLR